MKLVRGSEVSDFLRCRLRWKYAWVDGYKSKKQNGKLFIGTLIHKYLEHWHRGVGSPYLEMQQLFEETDTATMDPLELNEMWDMASKVTANYDRHYGQNSAYMDVIATELQFAIPLDDEIVYTGTIDLVYSDEDGNIWLMDHKTTKELAKYEKNAMMDRQISRYWWAMQQLMQGEGYILQKYTGIDGKEKEQWVSIKIHSLWSKLGYGLKEVFGFSYNILLKAVPEPPKKLVKGNLSKDKAQNTTYEMYLKEIEANGFNRDDYEDILKHLADNGKRYFSRITVQRNQNELESAIEEFYYTAKDSIVVRDNVPLIDNKGRDYVPERIYRNITGDCSWDCSFKDVCVAGMDGSNVNYLLNIAFNKEEVKNGFNIQKTD